MSNINDVVNFLTEEVKPNLKNNEDLIVINNAIDILKKQEFKSKNVVLIDSSAPCEWLYGPNNFWKEEVCENFDETFVLMGNRDYCPTAEATWYIKAKAFMKELEESDSLVNFQDYGLTKEDFDELVKDAYNKYRYNNDTFLFLVSVLTKMYPDDEFETDTIRGDCQSEWQDVLYKKTNLDSKVIQRLEAFYFGKITEIFAESEDDNISMVLTNDEIWNLEKEGKLKEFICSEFDLNMEDTIFKYNSGTYTVTKFTEF